MDQLRQQVEQLSKMAAYAKELSNPDTHNKQVLDVEYQRQLYLQQSV